eukprot:GHVS01039732.1.p1 GENE.GHVS01039732.1~~GHVS01039732.1.p1  ORF type:complete len:745 (+),score=147.66 GHVS01039732.1:79-2313(+)
MVSPPVYIPTAATSQHPQQKYPVCGQQQQWTPPPLPMVVEAAGAVNPFLELLRWQHMDYLRHVYLELCRQHLPSSFRPPRESFNRWLMERRASSLDQIDPLLPSPTTICSLPSHNGNRSQHIPPDTTEAELPTKLSSINYDRPKTFLSTSSTSKKPFGSNGTSSLPEITSPPSAPPPISASLPSSVPSNSSPSSSISLFYEIIDDLPLKLPYSSSRRDHNIAVKTYAEALLPFLHDRHLHNKPHQVVPPNTSTTTPGTPAEDPSSPLLDVLYNWCQHITTGGNISPLPKLPSPSSLPCQSTTLLPPTSTAWGDSAQQNPFPSQLHEEAFSLRHLARPLALQLWSSAVETVCDSLLRHSHTAALHTRRHQQELTTTAATAELRSSAQHSDCCVDGNWRDVGVVKKKNIGEDNGKTNPVVSNGKMDCWKVRWGIEAAGGGGGNCGWLNATHDTRKCRGTGCVAVVGGRDVRGGRKLRVCLRRLANLWERFAVTQRIKEGLTASGDFGFLGLLRTGSGFVSFRRPAHIVEDLDESVVDLFKAAVFCLLCRYNAQAGPAGMEGRGLQSAIPEAMMLMLRDNMGVSCECFASPFNATLPTYLSMFPDVDALFGSRGSFFSETFVEGSYEANPPFDERVMEAMGRKMIESLDVATLPLSFCVILPDWSNGPSPYLEQLTHSRHLHGYLRVGAGEHKYRAGMWDQSEHFTAVSGSCLLVLQNKAGKDKWPLTDQLVQQLEFAWTQGGGGGH